MMVRIALLVLVCSACVEKKPRPCADDFDCVAGLRCVAGECTSRCTDTCNCPYGSLPCEDGLCSPCGECAEDSHCGGGLWCEDRHCVECRGDGDCAPGTACFNGVCAECLSSIDCPCLDRNVACVGGTCNECPECFDDAHCAPGVCLDQRCADCQPGTKATCTCASGRPGVALCNGEGLYAACTTCSPACDPSDTFCNLATGVIGSWEGVVTTPWQAPYAVELTFFADGNYSARCLETECVAFYYGTDADSPQKVFAIEDLRADGSGIGEIAIFFGDSVQYGELDNIRLDGDNLDFRFWAVWGGGSTGPVEFDLARPVP